MGFLQQKKDFLSKPDKSGIGGIDEGILDLVNKINKNKDYYTTSSCAGRIILMRETGKKQESVFVFVTHNKASPKQILDAMKCSKAKELIYLKEEPCILHVACRAPDDAIWLVNLARQNGWKKSGIISIKRDKIMVEMVSTEILATPVCDKGKMLVSEEYLHLLISECNKKLKQTREKIKNLEKAFTR